MMKRCAYLSFFLLTSISIAQSGAQDWTYLYHPESSLSLGRGFNPSNPLERLPRCINYKTRRADNQNIAQANVELYLAQSVEQLSEAQNIDGRMSARVLMFNFAGNYSNSFASNSKSDSIYLVMAYNIIYGRNEIFDVQVTDQYKNLLSDPKAFASKCGSRIVTTETVGQQLNAIIQLDGVSDRTQSIIRANASGNAKFGLVKISMSASLSSELKSYSANNQLKISASGPASIDLTSRILSQDIFSGDPLTNIKNALVDTLKDSKEAKRDSSGIYIGPIYSYGIGSMENYVNTKGGSDLWNASKENALQNLAKIWFKTKANINILEGIKNGTSQIKILYTKGEINNLYTQYMPLLTKQLSEFEVAHRDCYTKGSISDGVCKIPKLTTQFDLTSIDDPPIDFGWKIVNVNDPKITASVPQSQISRITNSTPKNRLRAVSQAFNSKIPDQLLFPVGYIYPNNPDSISGYRFFTKDASGLNIPLTDEISPSIRTSIFQFSIPDDVKARVFPSGSFNLIAVEEKYRKLYCENNNLQNSLYIGIRDRFGNIKSREFATLQPIDPSNPDRCENMTPKYNF